MPLEVTSTVTPIGGRIGRPVNFNPFALMLTDPVLCDTGSGETMIRPKDSGKAAMLLLKAIFLAACVLAFARGASAQSSKSAPPLQKSASFGTYTANTYFDPNANSKDAYYEILRNKNSVYHGRANENGERFMIGTI
jgi:hypothetical protein